MEETIDLFPDWDDETASVSEIFDRIKKAENVQKNAKEAVFDNVLKLAETTLEEAPVSVKGLSFAADRGLFLLRGFPLDATLAEQMFTILFAETEDTLYEIHVFFEYDEETQNIFSCGILTRQQDGKRKEAWIKDRWSSFWNIHEDGPHDCDLCQDRGSCETYMANRFAASQVSRAEEMSEKVRKKYPGLIKLLKENNMNMFVVPD